MTADVSTGSGPGQMGEFLQARRGQLRPEDIGLVTYGERRRVPGLRREELAQLAGVSISYYTRLEQGQSRGASPEILEAIANALQLNDDERSHLRALATTAKRRRPARRSAPEHVNPAVRDLINAMDQVPALVLGRSSDVLAWNLLGHALLAGHIDPTSPQRPADRPNMAKLVFLDAHTRDLYADWPSKARKVVDSLRLNVGKHPEDSMLASLIGELAIDSPEFATMWADHRVRACTVRDYELRHPVVGTMTVTKQTLIPVQAEDQSLVTILTEPGSASAAALKLLGQATAPFAAATRRVEPAMLPTA